MAYIDKYQENSGNSSKKNGFESANSAVEIADQMKSILKEHMGSASEKTKAKHLLQMSSMQSAKDRQESEIAGMQKEIRTLTRALTTLTHKMMEKSSRRGDFESDGRYETEESEKENTRRHNNRSRADKQKFNNVDKKTPRGRFDEKWSPDMKYDPDGTWTRLKKGWFKRKKEQHQSNQLEKSDPQAWKKAEKKKLTEKMKALGR